MNKLFLIAGPCIIENSETPLLIGKEVKSICDELGIDLQKSKQDPNRQF
jgi:2-dehydro-3-deoxyphosphooctonate aldolase (KDO 8-P synthase)